MTDAEYKHLGKAVEAAVELASKLETLHPIKSRMAYHIAFLIGQEKAADIIKRMCCSHFPANRVGDVFIGILETVEEKK